MIPRIPPGVSTVDLRELRDQLPGRLALPRYGVQLLPFSFTLWGVREPRPGTLEFASQVLDRDNGLPLPLSFTAPGLPPHAEENLRPAVLADLRAQTVRSALQFMLLHELDEVLRWMDGTHITDPHERDR